MWHERSLNPDAPARVAPARSFQRGVGCLQAGASKATLRAFRTVAAILLSWFVAGAALADPMSASEFHATVLALYGFEPHKLNQADMQAKSDQLDRFWSSVSADPAHTLPLLRRELEDPSNSAFFFYDGSKLVLSLSQDRSDQALALRSIPKADLLGIQHTDYLQTVHWFASKGFDTREAAYRILAFPNFRAFIPQHVLTLGQDYALIYMLFPMDEKLFVADLAKQLSLQRNVQSQKSLLLALWYAATPAANAAMEKFVDTQDNPAEARTYAKALLSRNASLASVSFSSAQSLREERRKVMQRPISDEALIEFDELTAKILGKQ